MSSFYVFLPVLTVTLGASFGSFTFFPVQNQGHIKYWNPWFLYDIEWRKWKVFCFLATSIVVWIMCLLEIHELYAGLINVETHKCIEHTGFHEDCLVCWTLWPLWGGDEQQNNCNWKLSNWNVIKIYLKKSPARNNFYLHIHVMMILLVFKSVAITQTWHTHLCNNLKWSVSFKSGPTTVKWWHGHVWPRLFDSHGERKCL